MIAACVVDSAEPVKCANCIGGSVYHWRVSVPLYGETVS